MWTDYVNMKHMRNSININVHIVFHFILQKLFLIRGLWETIVRIWTIFEIFESISRFCDTRGKKILEQLSRTRFFTELENPALFPCYVAAEKRAGIPNHVKNRVLESFSNFFSPLVLLDAWWEKISSRWPEFNLW